MSELPFRAIPLIMGLLALSTSPLVSASPVIQHWETNNGARVYYVPAQDLPMVDVRIVFDAGSARDGTTPSLALLTNGMLGEGAGGLDTNQIAERFENLGAQFGNGAQRDMAWVSLRTLSDDAHLPAAAKLLATILQQPNFPLKALERERERLLVALQQQKQRPGSIADKAFYAGLYGNHPYASPVTGDAASVATLKQVDLKAFYQRHYVAQNALVAIVGDVDRSQAEALAEQLVGKLRRGVSPSPVPEVAPLSEEKTVRIEHPSKQSHVLVGVPGMKRGDADYFTLYVGNHILGGSGLVSRLSDEIREKRGLSYSVYSYFMPMAELGPYQMGLQTRNDQADEALELLKEELEDFIEDGPTEEELIASKKNITGGFPLRIDSNKKIIGYLGMIGFYRLPLDYLDRFNDRINAVTVDDIKDAFERRIDTDKLFTVVVGAQEQ